MEVNIKLLNDLAKVPTKAHEDDFCYDLYATSCEEIAPNVFRYGTGIALQLSENEMNHVTNSYEDINVGFTIRPRSSIYKTGMVLSNSAGTIDHGYTGEIMAVFYKVNPYGEPYKVGDRIGQLHFDWTMKIDFHMVEDLSETDRGGGGYGSTGR